MNVDHQLSEPPSLREFLAAGCDLAAVPGIELPLLFDLIDEPPASAAKWARWYRGMVDAWLRGVPDEIDLIAATVGRPPRQHSQGDVCRWSWAAEALEDPDPGLVAAIRRAAGRDAE